MYPSLDEIYDNIELISGAVQKKLIAGKDSAYMSKQLATMFSDAPIDLDLEAMDVKKYDAALLRQKLSALEFKSLVRQLPEAEEVLQNPFDDDNDAPVASSTQYKAPKLVAPSAANFADAAELYVYARSRGAHGDRPELVVVGCADWVTIIEPKDFDAYKEHFTKPLIGYDVKHAMKSLITLGLSNPVVGHDVQVGAFLINSLDRALGLDDLAERIDLQATNLQEVPTEDIGEFAPSYIAALVALTAEQRAELAKIPSVQSLMSEIEWPVIPVLAHMERRGIGIDVSYFEKMSKKFEGDIAGLEQAIYDHAEREFNISSPQQLAVVLFDDLGLPTNGVKKGKTGYSTAANELDKLRPFHPIIDLITQYRELTKLKSTYIDTLPKLVDDKSRLHTTFNLTVAQTGRLSSADPNLQNIPVRSDLGRTIRTGFIARPDHVFVSADYSQLQWRGRAGSYHIAHQS
jgi:DNA polymerase-1